MKSVSGSSPAAARGAAVDILCGLDIPFANFLGVEFLEVMHGRVVSALSVAPAHTNSAGVAHGGAIMTLLDVTMAVTGRSVADAPAASSTTMATIEMKTSFMRGGRGRLTCTGHCVHRTRSMAFCEAEVRDERGEIVARASGTFKFVVRKVSADE